MLTHDVAFGCFHRPGLEGQIPVEKLAEWSLADKTNASRVFFLRIGQL